MYYTHTLQKYAAVRDWLVWKVDIPEHCNQITHTNSKENSIQPEYLFGVS